MLNYNISLSSFNSFGIDTYARRFFRYNQLDQLQNFIKDVNQHNQDLVVFGGGSNILLTEPLDPVVIHPVNKHIHITDSGNDKVTISADAGVVWDDLVSFSLDHNLYGIENLSMIPGNCGAAPIQNIGAYGAELSEVFLKLEAVDLHTGEIHKFTGQDCEFGYRDSIFKTVAKGKFCINRIYITLEKNGSLNLDYGSIRETLETMEISSPTPTDVSNAVRRIRGSKLPDPQKLGNAGSFFKNPIVRKPQYENLLSQWPDMPGYSLSDERKKIPAGWLIDRAGWKGYRHGNAAVHERQALVLVNLGGSSGREILELAETIRRDIDNRFGILLEPEVNIWNRQARQIALA